jgi:hypothetical protein
VVRVSAFESKLTVLCAATLSVWLTMASPVTAQQPSTGRISGVVVDSSGGVLPGVVVSANASDGRTLSTMVTSGTGEFAFAHLPAGTLELRFHLDGFEDAKTKVSVNAFTSAEPVAGTVTQTLALKGVSEMVVVRAEPPPAPPKPRPVLQPVVEHDPSATRGHRPFTRHGVAWR